MFVRPNFYSILGLSKNATPDEIKKSYRQKALLFHPDKASENHLNPEYAAAEFRKVHEAYEALRDAVKKRKYDSQQFAANSNPPPKRQETTNSAPFSATFSFTHDRPRALQVIASGNLGLLKYLEVHEGLDIFASSRNANHLLFDLCAAACKNSDKAMASYLFFDKKLLARCQKTTNAVLHMTDYFKVCLSSAIRGHSLRTPDDAKKADFIRWLLDDLKFILPEKMFLSLITEARSCEERVNALLQSQIAKPHYKYLLLRVAEGGLASLTLPELFRLYNANILKNGLCDVQMDIRFIVTRRTDFSAAKLTTLARANKQFAIDALFYYAGVYFTHNLTFLKIIMDCVSNIDVENEHHETAINYAYCTSSQLNDIVKLFIERGADVYRESPTVGCIADKLYKRGELTLRFFSLYQKRKSCVAASLPKMPDKCINLIADYAIRKPR